MPNVLNISSYKKVGLFLLLRKASPRSRSLEIRNETRGLGGPNSLNAGVCAAFSPGKVVFQACVFHHGACWGGPVLQNTGPHINTCCFDNGFRFNLLGAFAAALEGN